MLLPEQRWLKAVFLATTLVFLGVAIYLYGFRFFAWIESDASVTALLAARVLRAGSPVVGDWYYANGDVWVLAPHLLAVVPVAVLGLGPVSLLVSVLAGLVVEILALARFYARLAGERWAGWFAALVTLMAWSQAHVAFVYIQIGCGFSTMIYLLSFGSFATLGGALSTRPWRWIAAGLFVAVMVAQNPTRGLAFVLAPLIVGCAWPWRGLGLHRRFAMAATVTLGWLLAAAVYTVIFQRAVSFSVPRGHIDFALKNVDGVLANLDMLRRGLAMLCAGTEDHVWHAVPGALVMIGAIVIVSREVFAARALTATRFVSVVVSAQLAGLLIPLLIGNLLVSPASVRYLMPSLMAVFGLAAVLMVRALGEVSRGWRYLATGWLVVVPLAALVATPGTRPPVPENNVWPNARELQHLGKELARRGLTHGFSNVINANILNLESRGRSTTCPVFFANVLIPQRWLADTSCYTPTALPERFYVVVDHDERDEASVRATLMEPSERFHVGKAYEIQVFRTAQVSLAWLELPIRDADQLQLPLRLPATHLAIHRGTVALEAGKLVATGQPGYVVFGPYLRLLKGTYRVVWTGSAVPSHGELTFTVAADLGQDVLAHATVPASSIRPEHAPLAELSFTLDRARDAVEFPIASAGGARVSLDEVVLERR